MTSVALIACDHGLGHVRRCALVAEALVERGAAVTLFAPSDAVTRVRATVGIDATGVVDVEFRTGTTAAALRSGDPVATRWEVRLPDLTGFDRVVVDTLPEVIAVRPDALLLAQFVWHEVLEGVDDAYRTRAMRLLEGARTVIGSELFTMPTLRRRPGFIGVGLYARANGGATSRAPGALLVSGGTTSAVTEPLRRFVAACAAAGPGPFDRILVDGGLEGADPPPWVQRAAHDASMYDDVALAVVRPGLGVLSELVARGVPAWCVREGGNAELAHNASVVAEQGLGRDLGTVPLDAAAVDRWSASHAQEVLAQPLPAPSRVDVRCDGAEAAARAILG